MKEQPDVNEQPSPIIVSHLFPELLDGLLALLSSLSAKDWDRATVCKSWSVKDVSLHLLSVEIGNLSRKRDAFSPSPGPVKGPDELLERINDLNATWVQATQRISPRLLCDLLQFTGSQACEYFQSLDPYQFGEPVSWAGPDPAPVWLDLAREYTERWHHQQHIRDAVGRSGFKQPRFMEPVLDTFVRALPHTYRTVSAPDGTIVTLTISGRAGGQWSLLREEDLWKLYLDLGGTPDAEVTVDEDIAWRLFSKGISQTEGDAQVIVTGNQQLGRHVLDMVSIIA